MRGLDNNEEAKNLLENLKGSIENRMRSLYNLGYWQGFNDGQREAVQMLERTLMDMTMADRKTENNSEKPNNFDKDINVRSKDEPQTYITEDRTQMLDRWQTYHRNTTSAVTPCSNCQEFDCYGCEYKQTERSE